MTIDEFLSEWESADRFIRVTTSGSTGAPKRLLAEKSRMIASAEMTCDFLQLKPSDTALLAMPLEYIAGKMMVVRAIARQLRLICVEPSAHPLEDNSLKNAICLENNSLQHIDAIDEKHHFDFIAMTPMQVSTTLENDTEAHRLRCCRRLLIGGGAISERLEEKLKEFPHEVWSSYGMTETLSHIALRPIGSPWYRPMKGIGIGQAPDNCLTIDAPMLVDGILKTNDIVEMNSDMTAFKVVGRKDNVICSGGIKIQTEELERILYPYTRAPFLITKRKDDKYGEIVVMLTERGNPFCGDNNSPFDFTRIDSLPRYWQPKLIIEVEKIPLTGTGKPDRAAALRLANEV